MSDGLRIELSAQGVKKVVFNSSQQAQGLHVSKEAVKGLWSAPSVKTSLTERQTGDGAFPAGDVLYSARTVTLPFVIVGYDHAVIQQYRDMIGRLMGVRNVRMTVWDGAKPPFYVDGFIEPSYSDIFERNGDTGSIDITCVDPRRYSVETHDGIVNTTGETGGGLNYNGGKALEYPIDYGASVNNSIMTLENKGSYKSYPTLTLNGTLNDPVRIAWNRDDGHNGEIVFNSSVGYIPVVLDCERRSANIGGLDVTYRLGGSSFPYINPNGALSLRLLATGSGWMSVSSHDIWM